jgi:transglutaminase-like putative cysteine protease
MLLKISHTTHYSYDSPVEYALQQARLRPKSRAGQSVISWNMKLEGAEEQVRYDDEYNNHVILLSILPGQSGFSVHCDGEVETADNAGIVGTHGGFAPLWHFKRSTDLTKAGPLVKALAKQLGTDFANDIERFHALSHMISSKVAYEIGTTDTTTVAEAALERKHGVCQDHAHIFIACARILGFPARYVSGYLMIDDMVDQDATHAWAEVHLPDLGWVGFDVSNGISPDERYVRVATGLDYHEAAPVSGIRLGNSIETMIVSIQVQQ